MERIVMKRLDTPEFHSILKPNVLQLKRLFVTNGHEIRIVGGAVRDLLSGSIPTDLDFATTATMQMMKQMFQAEWIPILNSKGEVRHGTVTARIRHENFEITTLHGYRTDVDKEENWRTDAKRRDFTINAMNLGFDGIVCDYFGGCKDLKDRRVVFLNDAEITFKSVGYHTILRYFRFCAKLSSQPDSETLKVIRNNLDGFDRTLGERLWMEIKKMCSYQNKAGPILQVMLELGMAKNLGLKDTVDMQEFELVWKRARDNDVPLEAVTFFAALMRTEAEISGLYERFEISKYEKRLARFLIKHRQILSGPAPLKLYMRLAIDDKTLDWTLELLRYQGRMELLEMSKCNPPQFPSNARTLIDIQVPRGMMGPVMILLRNTWIDSDFQLSEEELTAMLPAIFTDLKIVPTVKS